MPEFRELPLLFLAAGEGLRMRPITGEVPKQVFPLPQIPKSSPLAHSVRKFVRRGFSTIWVALGYRWDLVLDHLITALGPLMTGVHTVVADEYARGPLHTFLAAEINLGSYPVLAVSPGDTVYHPHFLDNLPRDLAEDRGHLLCYPVVEPSPHDVLVELRASSGEQDHLVARDFVRYPVHEDLESIKHQGKFLRLAPLIVLPGAFFIFARIGAESGQNRLEEPLATYTRATRNMEVHIVQWDTPVPPFMDIDSPDAYDALEDYPMERER